MVFGLGLGKMNTFGEGVLFAFPDVTIVTSGTTGDSFIYGHHYVEKDWIRFNCTCKEFVYLLPSFPETDSIRLYSDISPPIQVLYQLSCVTQSPISIKCLTNSNWSALFTRVRPIWIPVCFNNKRECWVINFGLREFEYLWRRGIICSSWSLFGTLHTTTILIIQNQLFI